MLKFLENSDEVLDFLEVLAEQDTMKDFRIGVSGSYAEGLNKKNSAIDIVLKLKDGGDKSLIGSFEIINYIHSFMEDVYSNKVCIYWLDLLEKDETVLLDYMSKNGYEANPESAYTNLVGSAKWVDEENEDDKNDRISKTVMTWNEDDDNGNGDLDEEDSDKSANIEEDE